MYCGILETTSAAEQTMLAGGLVNFNNNKVVHGVSVMHSAGANNVLMEHRGTYYIGFEADVTPVATVPITISILNNGVEIAQTTFNGTAATATHVSLNTLQDVLPSCCVVRNNANITVSVNAASTVTNADLLVMKIR